MINTTQSNKSSSKQDCDFNVDEIFKALQEYERSKQEHIYKETIAQWIIDFKALGWNTAKVVAKIKNAKYKQIYGRTSFSDFLDDEDLIIDPSLIYEKTEKMKKCCYELIVNEWNSLPDKEKTIVKLFQIISKVLCGTLPQIKFQKGGNQDE